MVGVGVGLVVVVGVGVTVEVGEGDEFGGCTMEMTLSTWKVPVEPASK